MRTCWDGLADDGATECMPRPGARLGMVLDRAAFQPRIVRQAALGGMQVATVGHLPTSSFSDLCASASTATGANHAAQVEEPGSRTGAWGRGRSELVLALSLSLSFTSQRRSLCSARWRAQGWRGECRSKASDQVGKPWLPSQVWGLESHTQWQAPGRGRHQDVRCLCGRHRLLGPSFTRHRTLKCQNSGRLGCILFLRL